MSEVDTTEIEACIKMSVIAAFQTNTGFGAITWERLKESTDNDSELSLLKETLIKEIPTARAMWPEPLNGYWKLRDEFSIVDGVVVYKDRVVIPKSLRPEVLEILHSAHQGVVGMKNRARQSVYWPGLNAAINQRRQQCSTCNRNAPSQPASPAMPLEAPSFPFQMVCSDYFSWAGYNYVIYLTDTQDGFL